MKRSSTIDWNQVFIDLSTLGYSVRLIAVETEIPRSTLDRLKNLPGTEPKYCDAVRVISLWCDVTGKDKDNLPAIFFA